MLSRPATTLLGAAALGFGCALLPAPASAADVPVGGPSESTRRTADAEAERQAALVSGEDERLMNALVKVQPTSDNPSGMRGAHRVRAAGPPTLVLGARKVAYTFDDLRKLAPDTLVPEGKGTFLLRENIVVAAGATLVISPTQPLRIKMSSGPEGFVSLISQGGRLRLNGSVAAPITFQSWDASRGRQDTDVTDGRAYVRGSSQLVVRHTTFSRLGFWSGRTGGVAVVGAGTTPVKDLDASTAVEDKVAGDPAAAPRSGKSQLLPAGKLPTAAQDPNGSYGTQISDATMIGNAFGLFVTGNSGARIENTVIRKSLHNGLVLHRDVDAASVKNVRVEGSGSDGVVVSRKVEGTLLTRLVARSNGRDGIVLAGRPLADGPSASGSSTRSFGNNVLTSSESSDNARIGVHVIGGTAVRVQGNTVNGGRSGIVVSDGADGVDIDSNRVAGAATNGIQVRESRQVTVAGNVVRKAQTGIHVRNSTGTFRQNSTSGVTLHGITFVGRVAGSLVEENLLSGSGTSAIDLVRVTDQQVPTLTDNDLSGWSRTVTSDSLVSVLLHPLTVIWMLVALMLLATSRPRRGGGGLPYRTDPLIGGNPSTPSPLPGEPTSEREVPVFVIPERRAPAPSPRLVPALLATPSRASARPVSPASAPPASAPPVPVPAAPSPPVPVAPRVPQPVGRVGHEVIDLAIREARLNPAAPRRRRVNGR